MGYEDRDYMRVAPQDATDERGSNPLWWILGLIVLILVVGLIRRGSVSEPPPGSVEELVATTGTVLVCEAEFVPERETARALLPVLKSFFRHRGYDSTVHEAADDSIVTAQFTHLGRHNERLVPLVNYRWIGPNHHHLKARHVLQIAAYGVGVRDAGPLLEELTTIAVDLRVHLEQEVPGSVLRYDDKPRSMNEVDLD